MHDMTIKNLFAGLLVTLFKLLIGRSSIGYMTQPKVHQFDLNNVYGFVSAGGTLYCFYGSTVGSTQYFHVYNADATTDESTTYRFTCVVSLSL